MPGRRHRLGQHMLVDGKILKKIIDAANISKGETVCEAGTGRGALTLELCRRARKVISYEVDSVLYEAARKELHFDNLTLVKGDIFDAVVEFDVFVSNLPYSRSRDAIEWLATKRFSRGVVMVQREFAEKLRAAPGEEDYRSVSALAASCFSISQVAMVGKGSFSPQPRVDSVILKIMPVRTVSRETIKNLNWLFSKRNRKASTVAAKLGIPGFGEEERRVDQLEPATLVQMAGMAHDLRAC